MLSAWSEVYSNSAVWRSVILYAHIAGMLVGGGCAVAADRMTLLASAGDEHQLNAVAGVHRVVLAGIASLVVSGLLLFAANLETFLVSPFFWTKMVLFALLLVNGLRVTKAEQAARAGDASGWMRLRAASVTSLILWLLVALCGAILPNV